jgi:hypothetical protein
MIAEGAIPIHGMRIMTVMDDAGKTWVQWSYAGEPSIEEIVSMLSRMTFLTQIHEFARSMSENGGTYGLSGLIEESEVEEDED